MSETQTTTEAQIDITDDLDAFATDFFGQKPPAPEQASPNAAQEAKVEATEAQETEVDPNDDLEAELVEAPPKKKTVQDRIDELVRQREEVKRESAAEVERLRQEFEAFKQSQAKTEVVKTTAEPTPDDTKEDGTPKYTLGEFDPQYIRDLTRYTLETERNQAAQQAEVDRQRQQEDQARQSLTTEWNEKVESAKTEYPDFMEKGQALLKGFENLDTNYAGYLSTVLMSMDKGPDVLYYLSNHPDEAAKIVNSGAQRATLALGRIEAKFIEADAQKTLAKPKVSQAPPPVPAQARARGTNGAFVSVAPDTDDLDAFAQEFFKQRK